MRNIESLIDAIDFLKSEEFHIDFNVKNGNLISPDLKIIVPINKVTAIHTIKIEADSDADNTSYIMAVVTPNGEKGIIIDGAGSYANSDFASIKRNVN